MLVEDFGDWQGRQVLDLATGTGIPNSNNSMLDVLVHGRDVVSSNFLTKYETGGFAPMTTSVVTTTKPASGAYQGAYELEGFPLAFSTPNTYTAHAVLTGVPSRIVKIIWASQNETAFNASTSVTTGSVQHSAATAGTHTLTLEFPI